jgi:enoyl-CoA hydratase
MTDDRVLLAYEGDVATVTLNRADKLNAIDPKMLAGLEEIALDLDRNTDVRVVIVTGTGDRSFCVGADINAWSALEPLDMWRRWVRDGHRVFDAIARLRQPTIAAVNGFTFGGGLELALCADIRIAAEGATFAAPEVKIGTIPGWGGTKRLPALIGPARAKQMIFSGAHLNAETAERWGLVNQVVPIGDLAHESLRVAEEIAANAPISVQLAKQIIDGHDGSPSVIEALAGALAATTGDGKEGVASFKQKRAPRFVGN